MQRGKRLWVVRSGVLFAWLLGVGCGGRSALDIDKADAAPDAATTESCDGLDNDFDTQVDEDFRDEIGRYVADDHCGQCGDACDQPIANATEVGCGLSFEAPTCVALRCIDGFGPTLQGTCAPLNAHLCLPCLQDNECGDLIARSCATIADEQRCTLNCETEACPAGYECDVESLRCEPEGGSCSCAPDASFTVACILTDPTGAQCTGIAQCDNGMFSECTLSETCDEQDNDCDGAVDETFRNSRGAYSVDVHNCGMCGVDCEASERDGIELTCGGDPLAPSCVLDCPDLRDGLMPGDRVDGDRVIANGCECTLTSFIDDAGPVLTEGEMLDVNCDGADGDVLNSWYVAPDGSDVGPGSPTRPLRTIAAAITKAVESLSTTAPRRDIFIASGNYVESLRIPDGVRIHGGYRRDFLSLDPEGFRVVWIAPANTTAPGGAAAVVASGAGTRETVIEWVALRGLDATQAGAPAIGLWIEAAGPQLFLRDMLVRSGTPGDGVHGTSGAAGARPTTEASMGAVQRAAREDNAHECVPGSANTVNGGSGGNNTCDGVSVRGGNGGSPGCPNLSSGFSSQPPGTSGTGNGTATPGIGGSGGDDLEGPISGFNCPGDVCCGLADFTVPSSFRFPQAGGNGGSGDNGMNGNGCTDALGSFSMRRWNGGSATNGTAGRAGAGGGGGGGGGTAHITWFDGLCQFADGLGGGGGGGGGGGCGGSAGRAGTSGGPAIGIAIERSSNSAHLDNVTIETGRGGRGGDGGVGGEGALGGVGAAGGAIARQQQSTPTLAGPGPGARGGRGGNGGAGGGAGGGCGGGSIGVWLLGGANSGFESTLRTNNLFGLGDGGRAGRGGGGAVPAAAGIDGGMIDVLSR